MAEGKLVLKPEILLRIADAVPAIVGLYNIQSGKYLYVNRALTRLLGYRPEQFTAGGMEFVTGLVHPQDLTPVMTKNQQALDYANQITGLPTEPIASFEYRMKHSDGSWHWLHTEGTVFGRDATGQVELLLNVSLDVTDRKTAELQLARSMKALEGVLKPQ